MSNVHNEENFKELKNMLTHQTKNLINHHHHPWSQHKPWLRHGVTVPIRALFSHDFLEGFSPIERCTFTKVSILYPWFRHWIIFMNRLKLVITCFEISWFNIFWLRQFISAPSKVQGSNPTHAAIAKVFGFRSPGKVTASNPIRVQVTLFYFM